MAIATAREIYNPVQRDRVTFLKTADETDGELSLLEMEVAPGGGNGLHIHTTYSERFTVLEGQLGVQIGKQQHVLRPGETGLVPIGAVHRWYNSSTQPARVLWIMTPASY